MTKNRIKHRRNIIYGDSIQKLRESLIEEIKWTKNEIINIHSSKIILKSIFGRLDRSRYIAEDDIIIKIDLLNESNSASVDIEAIYFYSRAEWILFQDNKKYPSTNSDLPGFKSRHFLTPPVRKLLKNSLAKLIFKTKRILGYAFGCDELNDSYRETGRTVLRLVTSEGNFEYELSLDVTIEEMPF
ncbi:hypothetical protein LEP1GSC186_3280 [Leptospira noguchii serovar Autumnalis str. ZUN142]|uniref:Uncharacterized protein n=1 Tax=Leptospira noguchii serovar Autumnalis str. ZUN142 TaxID=1085540 RepID=M6U518_9LEPT|nr:hypothetical protein [Leptospira noguchii]EMO39570.1 hypothetical protein LEP1GSC186_3280 [Leptospira noguchii serovar Autumnalis str. ZUN142]